MYQRHKAPQCMSSLLRVGNKSQSPNAVLALQMGNSNHSHSLQLLQVNYDRFTGGVSFFCLSTAVPPAANKSTK